MKHIITKLWISVLFISTSAFQIGSAQDQDLVKAIEDGLSFLEKSQSKEGYWSSKDYPGLSGLVIQSFLTTPDEIKKRPDVIWSGLDYIRSQAKEDGGIYSRGLSNYNTSIALATLLHANIQTDRELIVKARNYLVSAQSSAGGFGYEPTGKRSRPDLDNTVFAMEALNLFRKSGFESPDSENLDWQAAIDFVSQCQNLKATNDAEWVSESAEDKGGFTYVAGGREGETHSYGTMTYSGLLSLIHAKVDAEDQRVEAAIDWLARRFSVDENPGQGQQGLYYYYFVMAKALKAAEIDTLKTEAGNSIDWKSELGKKLLSLQKPDGSWLNTNGRWMESDPVLVTSYVVLTLNKILAE